MKTWGKVLIIVMGLLLSGSVGMNLSIDRGVDISDIAIEAFRDVVIDVVKEEIKPLKQDILDLKQSDIDDKTGRAISAYSKVFTIDDLKNSPEKRFSITQGLKLKSCYNILLTMDRERTILFYDYLIE